MKDLERLAKSMIRTGSQHPKNSVWGTLVYAAKQTNVIVVLLLCITAEKKGKGAGAGNTIQEDSLKMPETGFVCLNMRLSCLFYVSALCILLAVCLSCAYL